ncbi:glycosyltransferase WbuB [Nitrospira sp.]|nr:glycosyltransferase WbuB [Nitrospira sp.]
MPRVLFLTQYFPPEMGAAQTRLFELGQELLRLGWDVEVLTALPNYPTGRIFEGYNVASPLRETLGGLSVVRVPLRPAQRGFVERLICYYSFVRSVIRWGTKLCHKPDVLFVESPPLFIGQSAVSLSKAWNVPIIFNVSDLWPETAKSMGVVKNRFVFALAEALELSYYRRAALVTGTSDEIISSVRRRCPSTAAEVITNGVDIGRFGPHYADGVARALLHNEGRITFIYAGVMGLAQGLELILDVAATVRDLSHVQFVLVGEGAERESLERRIESENLSNVRLLRPQPKEQIPALLAASDVAFLTLKFNIPGAVPSKIYEAMATGLPILFAGEGEAARRIREAGAGLAIPYGDVRGLEKAVRYFAAAEPLRQQLGQAGRLAAEKSYSRKAIARRLHTLLLDIASRTKHHDGQHISIAPAQADRAPHVHL